MTLKLNWYEHNSYVYPIAYDPHRQTIITQLLCYAIHLQHDRNYSSLYTKNEMYHLVLFYNSCKTIGYELHNATDDDLNFFKQSDLQRLKTKSKSSEKSLKKVVNQRLVRIYDFFAWLQTYYELEKIIGTSGCQIRSSLNSDWRARVKGEHKNAYPLLFNLKGSLSRHTTQYSATESDIDNISEYFLTEYDTFVAQRNILIMKIGEIVSLRRGSINSLRCAQFSDEIISQAEDDHINIKPDSQKFQYSLSFKCPLHLALRINSFINNFLTPFLKSKGKSTLLTQDHLFISATTCLPLTNQAISVIFGKAFRAIGTKAPRVALHATRRKFTMDEIEKEIVGRQEMGLDTSDLSIASSVSISMGQTNPSSLQPYISKVQMRLLSKKQADREQHTLELMEENDRLRKELSRLRKSIQESR